MKIVIENSSSPGASFTENTNGVLIKIADWIDENNGPIMPLKAFRMRLQTDKGINDNNARNIYPLLKNCGFVDYEKNEELDTKHFFTNRGSAYVKALQTINLIKSSDYAKEAKVAAIAKVQAILESIVYQGLQSLFAQETNYNKHLKMLLSYFLHYGKIDKTEYAYLLYAAEEVDAHGLDVIKKQIDDYRNGELSIEVQVRVKNDRAIRDRSNEDHRLEDIGFLTSFSFFIALLTQAGVIYKEEGYFLLKHDKHEMCKKLLEVQHNA